MSAGIFCVMWTFIRMGYRGRGRPGRALVGVACVLLAGSTAGFQLAAQSAQPPRPPATARPAGPPPDASQAAERSAVGTLDQVDAAATQIVVKTSTGKVTFQVQNGATIRQGSKTLKPAELASHKGERVKVRYRETAGQRRTAWIMLAVPPKTGTGASF